MNFVGLGPVHILIDCLFLELTKVNFTLEITKQMRFIVEQFYNVACVNSLNDAPHSTPFISCESEFYLTGLTHNIVDNNK